LVLGWTAWRERPRHRLAIVLAALWIIAALALQYVFIWSRLAPTEADYWGDKYDVFHTNSKVSYASWWLEHQSDLAAFPGYRRRFWSAWLFEGGGLRRVDVVIWIVLHVAGLLAVLVERRVRDALLLVLPLATLWIFNAFGFWPAGVFRTNLFTIAYLGAIACVALDARRRARASLWTPIPALLLVVLPLCLFDRSWSAQKGAMTYESAFPDALRTLLALQRGRDVPPLVLDKGSHSCFLYYTELHPTISEEIGEALTEGFEVHRVGSEIDLSQVLLAGTAAADRVWVIMTRHDHLKPLMRKHQPLEKLAIIERVTIGEHTIAAVTASQADRPHRSRRRSRRHAR
jgi:hypothetical protein